MKRYILKHRNQITIFTLVVIVVAFVLHYAFHQTQQSEILLLVASIVGGIPIWMQALEALRLKIISIDLLVSIAIIGALTIQNYEESAIVAFLFLFGLSLEQRTLAKTRLAIQELVSMAPKRALRVGVDDVVEEVDVDDLQFGDVLLVKTGGQIPVDGLVIAGEGYSNEATITGESLPVFKQKDDPVYAGTILENGTLRIYAQKVGEDTTFGKIIELVEEAQDAKSQAERFIDRFSKYYTPVVLLLALVVWWVSQSVELAITILVLGCPGALVIGVPVSNVSGLGNGAKHGVLLKGSSVIQSFSKVDTMVFDKTGTLTVGNPEVVHVISYTKKQDQALQYLVSVERESQHPLAKAIIEAYKDIQSLPVSQTRVIRGDGIIAKVAGEVVMVGTPTLLKNHQVIFDKQMEADIAELENQGHSLVLVSVGGSVALLIAIRDVLRQDIVKDLLDLQKMGISDLVLLSGDSQSAVDVIAHQLGLSKAFGKMLPKDKAAYVKELQQQGHVVAFVGDGINDSPSLAQADIGIAMGSGTDVAIETSDVVLMNSDFHKLPYALGLAKATNRNMKQNIIIAIAVVIFLLLGVFFSQWMNMAIGMFVHEGSILVVILNGMRLLKYKLKK